MDDWMMLNVNNGMQEAQEQSNLSLDCVPALYWYTPLQMEFDYLKSNPGYRRSASVLNFGWKISGLVLMGYSREGNIKLIICKSSMRVFDIASLYHMVLRTGLERVEEGYKDIRQIVLNLH